MTQTETLGAITASEGQANPSTTPVSRAVSSSAGGTVTVTAPSPRSTGS